MNERFRISAVGLLVVLGLAAAAAGQEATSAKRVFTDSVRVDIVEVEVFVTDRQGRPILGLDRDDFELLIDGNNVEISNFRPPTGPRAEEGDQPPEATLDIEPAPPRHLAVFVDHTNLRPDRRAAVMASVRDLVEDRLAEGDRVMVAAYDSRVDVLSGFGDDAAALARALDAVDHTAASTFETQAEFNRILRCLEVSCQDPEFIWDEVRIYARFLRHRNRIMLAHLSTFIDSLAALPGRRAVLLVSDGIAVRPGESLFAAFQRIYTTVEHYGPVQFRFEANRYSLTDDIRELTDLANERRVTIYSLNGGGVVGNPLALQSAAVSSTQMLDIEIDFVRDANYVGSLERVAEATGGRVILKPTEETLSGVRQDLDSGYSLGFNPDHEPDGVSRSIKVKVAGGGFRVRHRDNYRLAGDEGSASELTRLALITAEAKNPLGISVEYAPTAQRQGRKYLVSAAVRIPLASITLIPTPGGRLQGSLEVTFLLEDSEGHSTPIQKEELPFDLPAEALSANGPGHITYDVGFMVRSGGQRLALTVTDSLGAESSSLSWNLVVAKDGQLTVSER